MCALLAGFRLSLTQKYTDSSRILHPAATHPRLPYDSRRPVHMTPFQVFMCVVLAKIAVLSVLHAFYPIMHETSHKITCSFIALLVGGLVVVAYYMVPPSRPLDGRVAYDGVGVRVPAFGCI